MCGRVEIFEVAVIALVVDGRTRLDRTEGTAAWAIKPEQSASRVLVLARGTVFSTEWRFIHTSPLQYISSHSLSQRVAEIAFPPEKPAARAVVQRP